MVSGCVSDCESPGLSADLRRRVVEHNATVAPHSGVVEPRTGAGVAVAQRL
jgi:hypothetical protein